MKILLSVACVIWLPVVSSHNTRGQTSPIPTPTPVAESKVDTPIEANLYSGILGEDRRIIVHLPRNYANDATQRYPVMYVLDGTSQDQHTAEKLTVLSDAGLLPGTLVVGIPNSRGNRERDQTPPFMRRDVNDPNSAYGAADKFLAFLEKELVPFIDGKYRTSSYRALSGNSRGGLFVLYSLIERPDLFRARFCYSAPVWRFDNLLTNKIAAYLRSRADVNTFLFISVGDKETEQMVGGFVQLSRVLDRHRKKNLSWVAYSTPHAVHQDNARISTSKGLAEWSKNLLKQNRTHLAR